MPNQPEQPQPAATHLSDSDAVANPSDTTRHWETVIDGERAPSVQPAVGGTFGAYTLIEEIGRGGVGVVYRAEQSRPSRTVAIKILERGRGATDDEVRRLQAEADAAAALDHPAVVPVHEVGEVDGFHFLAMAYVDGGTLADRLRNGPLPARDAAAMLRGIAEGIAYAHENGVIHRDLKPSNILLDRRGEPRVADFGLAKQLSSESQLTVTGQIMGTPSYMAPEQAAGRTHEVGPATDVYALGGVLYCMLTGRPPFQAATLTDTLLQVVERDPVAPSLVNPSVERDLETICLRCLEKSPERRYGSAAEVARELERYLDGQPIRARRVGPLGRAVRWCRRNTAVAILLATVALSLAGGAVLSTYFAIQASDRAEEIERLSRELVQLAIEVREAEAPEPGDTVTLDDEDVQREPIELARDDGFRGEARAVPDSKSDAESDSDTNTDPGVGPTADLDPKQPNDADLKPADAASPGNPVVGGPTADPPTPVAARMHVPAGGNGETRTRQRPEPSTVAVQRPVARGKGKVARNLRTKYQAKLTRLQELAPGLANEFSKAIDEEPDETADADE